MTEKPALEGTVQKVAIESVFADPLQPRRIVDEKGRASLAANIIENGQLCPVLVCSTDRGHMVLDGHRRLEAMLHAGCKEIEVCVKNLHQGDSSWLVAQLVANCQREDLNPLDVALGYMRLIEEHKLSVTDVAQRVSRSKGYVSSILPLTTLDDEIKQLITAGKIGLAAATQIARLPQAEQIEAARSVAEGKLDRKQLERRAMRKANPAERGQRRVSLQLGNVTAQFVGKEKINLAQLMDALDQLSKECRKARSQKLDISTLASILRDRHSAVATGGEA